MTRLQVAAHAHTHDTHTHTQSITHREDGPKVMELVDVLHQTRTGPFHQVVFTVREEGNRKQLCLALCLQPRGFSTFGGRQKPGGRCQREM